MRFHHFASDRFAQFVLDHLGGRNRTVFATIGDDEGDAVREKVQCGQFFGVFVHRTDAGVDCVIQGSHCPTAECWVLGDNDFRQGFEPVDFVDTVTVGTPVLRTEADNPKHQIARPGRTETCLDGRFQHRFDVGLFATNGTGFVEGNGDQRVFTGTEIFDGGSTELETATDLEVVNIIR